MTAALVLAEHADHPSAFLALNAGTAHFRAPDVPGFIAYRASGRWLFQLGGPFAPAEDRARLLAAFVAFARARRGRVVALELRADDVPLYRAAGYRVNQLGRSYTLELADFSLAGGRFVKLRNKIERARRAGVRVLEVGRELPASPELWARLQGVTGAWLASKGDGKNLLEFLVGELGEPDAPERRVFVAARPAPDATSPDDIVGFTTFVPAFGAAPALLLDLSRRMPDAPPGTMELVHRTAIERFRAEGIARVSFGMTPFVGAGGPEDRVPGRSRFVSWLMRTLREHGARIYPAQSQAEYKLKWAPRIIEPEYFAYEGRFRLGCLVNLLRLTRAV